MKVLVRRSLYTRSSTVVCESLVQVRGTLFHPPSSLPLAALARAFSGIKFYLPKIPGKRPGNTQCDVGHDSGQGDTNLKFERIRINVSHLGLDQTTFESFGPGL